jgi:hypothetical protein
VVAAKKPKKKPTKSPTCASWREMVREGWADTRLAEVQITAVIPDDEEGALEYYLNGQDHTKGKDLVGGKGVVEIATNGSHISISTCVKLRIGHTVELIVSNSRVTKRDNCWKYFDAVHTTVKAGQTGACIRSRQSGAVYHLQYTKLDDDLYLTNVRVDTWRVNFKSDGDD